MNINALITAVNDMGTAAVAGDLGFDVREYTRRGRGVSPCPACGTVERASRKPDGRGPVWLGSAGGWKCYACGVGDSKLESAWSFAAYAHGNGTEYMRLDMDDRQALIQWGCGLTNMDRDRFKAAPKGNARGTGLRHRAILDNAAAQQSRPLPDARQEATGAAAGIYGAAVGLFDKAAAPARFYLEQKAGLSQAHIEALCVTDCARYLPPDTTHRSKLWYNARNDGTDGAMPWPKQGRGLLIPTFDGDGHLVSCRGRIITEFAPGGYVPHSTGGLFPKEVGPAHESIGVMMNAPARELYRNRRNPSRAKNIRGPVLVIEGGANFLAVAAVLAHVEGYGIAAPVLGVYVGALQPYHADAIPEGTTVILVADNDGGLHSYRKAFSRAFGGRGLNLRRALWPALRTELAKAAPGIS